MLEKTIRINDLYDFYHPLLTPKQQNYMSLYYRNDFSLSEIAEEFNVSRQAVYDTIRRTEQIIEEYEQKLKLYEKFKHRQHLLQQLYNAVELEESKEYVVKVIKKLEKLD
ncbi:putative DNA-binding protein [Pueribacillus sp. YX66]|uniref:putative DNA-binding protein n=1 Tax=Pueribacillus sp. YX66 TaxID=3229242 RepID=UPI00358D1B32